MCVAGPLLPELLFDLCSLLGENERRFGTSTEQDTDAGGEESQLWQGQVLLAEALIAHQCRVDGAPLAPPQMRQRAQCCRGRAMELWVTQVLQGHSVPSEHHLLVLAALSLPSWHGDGSGDRWRCRKESLCRGMHTSSHPAVDNQRLAFLERKPTGDDPCSQER